jgi:hypothetical protein
LRALLRWFGFDGAKVASSLHPISSLAAGVADVGSDHSMDAIQPRERDSLDNDERDRLEFAQAEAQFCKALPQLLRQSHEHGRWVLYSATGLVEEGDDEMSFYEKYGRRIGTQLILGRVQPDPPEAEVTPNWFTTVVRSTTEL